MALRHSLCKRNSHTCLVSPLCSWWPLVHYLRDLVCPGCFTHSGSRALSSLSVWCFLSSFMIWLVLALYSFKRVLLCMMCAVHMSICECVRVHAMVCVCRLEDNLRYQSYLPPCFRWDDPFLLFVAVYVGLAVQQASGEGGGLLSLPSVWP